MDLVSAAAIVSKNVAYGKAKDDYKRNNAEEINLDKGEVYKIIKVKHILFHYCIISNCHDHQPSSNTNSVRDQKIVNSSMFSQYLVKRGGFLYHVFVYSKLKLYTFSHHINQKLLNKYILHLVILYLSFKLSPTI